jgi:membrane fusion protein (multidrug efflux system)
MAQAEVVEQQSAPPQPGQPPAAERPPAGQPPQDQPQAQPAPGQPQRRVPDGPPSDGPSLQAQAPQGQEPQGQRPQDQAPRRGVPRRFRLAAVLAVAVLAAAGVLYWLHSRQYEDTDDAEVDGHIHPIGARINGTVVAVNPRAETNKYVAAGTPLVDIDPADFKAEVDRAQAEADRLRANSTASEADVPVVAANATGQLHVAEATVAQARQGVGTELANLEATRARLDQAQATRAWAEADRRRYLDLLDKQEVSRSEYEQKLTAARIADAALDAAKADVVAAETKVAQARANVAQQEANLTKARTAPQQISESQARLGSASADLARAEAQLEMAKLNLSYTRIVVPVSGIIGRKTVEVGQRVQPGQELLTIVELDDVWVTANFKETQLRLMRPGQPAEVHVDTYGIDLPGHIQGIAPATGARFSLLPPENASGNFVKVVQRLPVRIRLDRRQDPGHPLRPGMSVDARVKVR